MTATKLTARLAARFGSSIGRAEVPSARRIYIPVRAEALRDIAGWLYREMGCRFATASAVDAPEGIEILYHFVLDPADLIVTLRLLTDRSSPSAPSLTPILAAAGFIEREIHELFGVDFPGHPDLRRLLLSDEWPAGVHPLRRDYVEWDPNAIREGGDK